LFTLTPTNMSTTILYMNASALVGAKSQTFDLGDEVMTSTFGASRL